MALSIGLQHSNPDNLIDTKETILQNEQRSKYILQCIEGTGMVMVPSQTKNIPNFS